MTFLQQLERFRKDFDRNAFSLCKSTGECLYENKILSVARSSLPDAGYGLFAKVNLPCGYILDEYVGEIHSSYSALGKRKTYGALSEFFAIDLVDGETRNGKVQKRTKIPFRRSCFAMHANDVYQANLANSCLYQVHQWDAIYLVTTRNIFKGEEIFVSYGWKHWYVPAEYLPCHRSLSRSSKKQSRQELINEKGDFKEKVDMSKIKKCEEYAAYIGKIVNKLPRPDWKVNERMTEEKVFSKWRQYSQSQSFVFVCPMAEQPEWGWVAKWSLHLSDALPVSQGGLLDVAGREHTVENCKDYHEKCATQLFFGTQVYLIIEKEPRRLEKNKCLWNFPEIKNILFDPKVQWNGSDFFYNNEPQVKTEVLDMDKDKELPPLEWDIQVPIVVDEVHKEMQREINVKIEVTEDPKPEENSESIADIKSQEQESVSESIVEEDKSGSEKDKESDSETDEEPGAPPENEREPYEVRCKTPNANYDEVQDHVKFGHFVCVFKGDKFVKAWRHWRELFAKKKTFQSHEWIRRAKVEEKMCVGFDANGKANWRGVITPKLNVKKKVWRKIYSDETIPPESISIKQHEGTLYLYFA